MKELVLAVLILIGGNSVEHNLGIAAVILATAIMVWVSKGGAEP
jgi:hypothetical protein